MHSKSDFRPIRINAFFLNALAFFALSITACCPSALAQQTLGSIAGTVIDPSGNSVSSATVTAVQDATQRQRIL